MGTNCVILQYSTSLEWSSALIRRLTHSRFSHVDIVLPDGNLLGASDNRDAPIIAGNARGVGIRPPAYQQFGIRCKATIYTSKADAIYQMAHTQIGKPFDSGALHQFLSSEPATPWADTGKWFCSEHVIWSFWSAGFFPYKLAANLGRISPADSLLILNPYFDLDTFEGSCQ